jgi:hypothetical protein
MFKRTLSSQEDKAISGYHEVEERLTAKFSRCFLLNFSLLLSLSSTRCFKINEKIKGLCHSENIREGHIQFIEDEIKFVKSIFFMRRDFKYDYPYVLKLGIGISQGTFLIRKCPLLF